MEIKGIKKICEMSKDLPKNGYGPGALQVAIDKNENRVFAIYHVSRSSWTVCDENTETLGWILRPATMDEIRAMIKNAIEYGIYPGENVIG